MELHTIGTRIGRDFHRIDAWAKVTGRAEFGDDLRLKDVLCCKGVYTQYPHARLLAVHVEEALRAPGVACVVTGADFPGAKSFGELYIDQYPLVCDKARFLGDVIAVVAAETPEQAEVAAGLVTAEYEVLPVLTDPRTAIGHEQVINPDYPDNVCGGVHVIKGDAARGLDEADVVSGFRCRTGFVEHAYLEPESVTVIPSRMRPELTVLGSIQAPYNVRVTLHRMLNLPMAQITVRPSVVGGSFGGKIESPEALAARAALVALKTGRPARYTLTREESIRESYKRHPIDFDVTLGARRDGTLTAMRVDALGDAGCYINMSPPVMYKTATLGPGPYRVEHVDYHARAVLTNNPHTGSMRGFGTPQAIFAMENAMDVLADRLGMTPIELRRKNLLVNGDVSPCGHRLDFNEVSARSVMEKAAAALGYEEKYRRYTAENRDPRRRVRRGVGLSVSMRGASAGADGNGADISRALIEVEEDGSVHVNIGLVELGQGLRTCQAMMAADMMGVSFQRITLGETDTSRSPATGACIASRGTFVGGAALQSACDRVHAILAQALAEHFGEEAQAGFARDRVRFGPHELSFDEAVQICFRQGKTPMAAGDSRVPLLDWDGHHGEPFYTYTYSCNAAEVEVDLDTGQVSVLGLVGCHDMGRAINPSMVEGQIYGGMAMAVGMALLEDTGHDPETSALKHLNLDNYLLPTALDIGEMTALTDPHPDPRSASGGRSLGEPTTENGAAALVCAINHALGRPGLIHDLPADLDRVFFAANPGEGR